MYFYAYKTGELLRRATAEEESRYWQEIEEDWTATGVVSGEPYGFPFPVYGLD